MAVSESVCNRSDGDELVCPWCRFSAKPCLTHPGGECPDKVQGGTQFLMIRERFREAGNGISPVCAACGQPLPGSHLRHRPLSDVCPDCRGSLTRGNARDSDKGTLP